LKGTYHLLSFDTTWTTKKKNTLEMDIQTRRQQGDLISLLTKIRGRYTERWAGIDGYTDRQQGDIIRLLLFFRSKESRLKRRTRLMSWKLLY
jgi:hypothetical protein